MEDIKAGMERITDLKVRKICLAIDDFGTGYSSLIYLKHFPFDRIKIAQEFVRDLPDDKENMAIVEAIFALAEALRLDVIAEGVERHDQLDWLCSWKCNEMQGFIFSHPLPAPQAALLLKSNTSHKHFCAFHA